MEHQAHKVTMVNKHKFLMCQYFLVMDQTKRIWHIQHHPHLQFIAKETIKFLLNLQYTQLVDNKLKWNQLFQMKPLYLTLKKKEANKKRINQEKTYWPKKVRRLQSNQARRRDKLSYQRSQMMLF